MKNPFQAGDIRSYERTVTKDDIAAFESGVVHELYSTFAIARDAEWCTRLFVLEMKEEDEEGIGTFVYVDHHAPAKVGSNIIYTGRFEQLNRNEVICNFEARTGDRLLASGKTGQKILKKEKLERLFAQL